MRGAWLSLAIVAGCWSFDALTEGTSRGGSDAGDVSTPPTSEGGSEVVGDGGANDGATADVFEASGPPPPATCATSGFACVTVAPAGWQGPFALYEGNAANAPSCGAVTQELAANANLATPSPAQCAACTCQNATGAGCGTITIEPQDNTCGGTGFKEQMAINTCVYRSYGTLVSGGYAAGGVRFSLPPVTGGACAPTVAKPTPTKPALSWAITAVACTTLVPTTPGCQAGQVCSAIPAPPFFAKHCIAQDGDISACPGAPYSQRHLYYKGVSDTRDCAACNCGNPNPAQCAATVSTGTDNTCNAPENVAAAPVCLGRDPGAFYYMKATTTVPTVTCPASGGAAVGTATPSAPITVCCEP